MGMKLIGAVSTLPLLLLFFVSEATMLVYEISWTRQIGLLFRHKVLAGSGSRISFSSASTTQSVLLPGR